METLGPTELRRMQGLAQEVMAIRPGLLNAEATLGELAWEWAKDFDTLNQFWRHRMWVVGDRLVGWGWVCLPFRIPRGDGTFRESRTATLRWQVHPDQPALVHEVLDWFDEVAAGIDRMVILQTADEAAQPIAADHGFKIDEDDEDWIQFNSRRLDELADPILPAGHRFLSASEVTTDDAVEAHRSAWDRSPFNVKAFERVQQTWPYRPDLHVLVEAPDGTLAATAIIWLDQATRTAQFEPVGTHRDHRRQGLGKALQLYGMHQAKAVGADHMFVACLGAEQHPAARDMYYDVGFRPLTRDLIHTKAAD